MEALAREKAITETKDWKVRFQKQFEQHSIEFLLIILFTICGLNYGCGVRSNNALA